MIHLDHKAVGAHDPPKEHINMHTVAMVCHPKLLLGWIDIKLVRWCGFPASKITASLLFDCLIIFHQTTIIALFTKTILQQHARGFHKVCTHQRWDFWTHLPLYTKNGGLISTGQMNSCMHISQLRTYFISSPY
jgi:hypothetical protein